MSTDPTVPVFVNTPIAFGFLNGVVNVAFSTAKFLPVDGPDGPKTEILPVITANLRMDLYCARQLYEQLGKILAKNAASEKDEQETETVN